MFYEGIGSGVSRYLGGGDRPVWSGAVCVERGSNRIEAEVK